ncbi:MAG: YqgE/AlgH family protein [Planctomycetota bacterium]
MKSLKGHFLVASPYLGDTNFFRSVVLMVQHDEEGAFGVVMNRPTSHTAAEAPELAAQAPGELDIPIHLGGPVPGPLIAVHSDISVAELEIASGIYFSTAKDAITQIVGQSSSSFRLFSGYSGWGPGQLNGELEAGGWLTDPATHEDVFSDYQTLWNRIARRIGLDILSPRIRPEQMPDDPSMN